MIALANSLSGSDIEPAEGDISAVFNSALDAGSPSCAAGNRWWYGVGGTVPSHMLDFRSVVLHELAHGLGFQTMVDETTGAKLLGFDDSFMLNLEDHSLGLKWPDMTDSQRAASAVDTGDLHWVGPNVVSRSPFALSAGVDPGGHVSMYAPAPPEPGTSVNHWDWAVSPDELMEPFMEADPRDLITTHALSDIGWRLQASPGGCTPGTTTLCIDDAAGHPRFQVQVAFQTSQQGGQAGNAQAIPTSSLGIARGGLFWFFSGDNPEMLVKLLDGCGVNNRYWVFTAAGTNVGLTTTMTDTRAGTQNVYTNPDLTAARPVVDVSAFACPEARPSGVDSLEGVAEAPLFAPTASTAVPWTASSEAHGEEASLALAACSPSATTLCIDDTSGDRCFRVTIDWSTVQDGGQSGAASAVSTSPLGVSRGGLFWFLSPDNPEVLVKVLNGCGVNNAYWVFASAATNVGLTARFTDTATGRARTYTNPDLNVPIPVQDVNAFPCLPAGPVITSFTASPPSIQSGQTSTLTWTSTDGMSASIDYGVGSVPTNGSVTVSPAQTTTYTLTVKGPDGTATRQATVTVRSASSWEISVLPEIGATDPSLKYDPTGNPSIAYVLETNKVKLARWDSATSSWSLQTVHAYGTSISHSPSHAYDPRDGHPSLVFGSDVLTFAHWDGSSWMTETIEDAGWVFDSPSLVYGPDGNPSVSYRATGGSPGVKLATRSGSGWSIQAVDPAGTSAVVNSLAYDPKGNPMIAYSANLDGTSGLNALKVARWASSGWEIEVVESGSQFYGVRPSLAFDATGMPAITHGSGPVGLRFVRWDGLQWAADVVAATGREGSLAFDGSGIPLVAYTETVPAAVKLARREPTGAWQIELVEAGLDSASHTDLVLDPVGRPSLAFRRSYGSKTTIGFARKTTD